MSLIQLHDFRIEKKYEKLVRRICNNDFSLIIPILLGNE
jgi:hypothetical protein